MKLKIKIKLKKGFFRRKEEEIEGFFMGITSVVFLDVIDEDYMWILNNAGLNKYNISRIKHMDIQEVK